MTTTMVVFFVASPTCQGSGDVSLNFCISAYLKSMVTCVSKQLFPTCFLESEKEGGGKRHQQGHLKMVSLDGTVPFWFPRSHRQKKKLASLIRLLG